MDTIATVEGTFPTSDMTIKVFDNDMRSIGVYTT